MRWRQLRHAWILVLAAPFVVSVVVALGWDQRGISHVTGDETHYLMIADAIVRDHTLDVRQAYERDLRTAWIYGRTDSESHTRTGPHGTFSIHGIGLPILLAPIWKHYGLSGVRVMLCAIAGAIPFLFFGIARRMNVSFGESVALALASSLSLPYLVAPGQVYPDLASGVAILGAICMVVNADRRAPHTFVLTAYGWLVAILPWLHEKNLFAAVVLLVLVLAMEGRRSAPQLTRVAAVGAPITASMLVLLGYQWFAFGSVWGPYSAQTAAGANAWQATTIFLGLHLDQLQGTFLQQPFFVLGVAGLPVFFRDQRRLAVGVAACALAVLVPNAFHDCWYGCGSFGGRFMWTSMSLWFHPIVSMYAVLGRVGRRLVLAAAALCVTWQAFLIRDVFLSGPTRLYTQMWLPASDRRSVVTGDLRAFLPSFLQFDHVVTHVPNLVAIVLLCALAIVGVAVTRRTKVRVESDRPVGPDPTRI